MSDETYFTNDFGVNLANVKYFKDDGLATLLSDSYNAGVNKIVSISNSAKESQRNVELAFRFENVHFTVGIHPHSVKNFHPSDLIFMRSSLLNPKCYGVGECGLDYYRNFSEPVKQREVFKLQVKLAKETNSNLYLHCREAYDDFIKILKEENYFKGIVHCFTGNVDQATELTQLGFKIGITGFLLNDQRNKDLKIVVEKLNINHFVTETDAPFMSLHGKKTSSPTDTYYIVEKIAEIKKMGVVKCGKILYENSLNMLNTN